MTSQSLCIIFTSVLLYPITVKWMCSIIQCESSFHSQSTVYDLSVFCVTIILWLWSSNTEYVYFLLAIMSSERRCSLVGWLKSTEVRERDKEWERSKKSLWYKTILITLSRREICYLSKQTDKVKRIIICMRCCVHQTACQFCFDWAYTVQSQHDKPECSMVFTSTIRVKTSLYLKQKCCNAKTSYKEWERWGFPNTGLKSTRVCSHYLSVAQP